MTVITEASYIKSKKKKGEYVGYKCPVCKMLYIMTLLNVPEFMRHIDAHAKTERVQ